MVEGRLATLGVTEDLAAAAAHVGVLVPIPCGDTMRRELTVRDVFMHPVDAPESLVRLKGLAFTAITRS